jgi:hypothetical protein
VLTGGILGRTVAESWTGVLGNRLPPTLTHD